MKQLALNPICEAAVRIECADYRDFLSGFDSDTVDLILTDPPYAISAVELQGYKKVEIRKPIPARIRKQFKEKRCAVLDISRIEIDHKDGRLDDPRLSDPSRVKLGDFQAFSKPVNNAKRSHCKRCRETDRRYDARRLGFPIAQYAGDEIYNGTCIGCYWHDPRRFIEKVCEKLLYQHAPSVD